MRISVDGYVAGPNGEEDWDLKSDEMHPTPKHKCSKNY